MKQEGFVESISVCDGQGMEDVVLAGLSPVYRVALGSARSRDRAAFAALFALDVRLDRAVREASEPIIAQVKLAWWRDRFAQQPSDWPAGEPLLAQLSLWGGHASSLGNMVDGWEELVAGEPHTAETAERFVEGRAASWRALADVIGAPAARDAVGCASHNFSRADLRERGFGDPEVLGTVNTKQGPLPRALRPLAVLGNLGRRSISKNRPMLDGFPSLALALRTGLTGW